MEEFRPMLDRFVLSLINKKQFGKKDFTTLENGAVALKDDARQLFLKAWHDRKQQTLYHDWFEELRKFLGIDGKMLVRNFYRIMQEMDKEIEEFIAELKKSIA